MMGLESGDLFSGLQDYVLAALIFAVCFLTLEAIFVWVAGRTATRGDTKRRLSRAGGPAPPHAASLQVRQRRGLSARGAYNSPVGWLNRLLVQSAVKWGIASFQLLLAGLSLGIGAGMFLLSGNAVVALVLAMIGGIGMPVLWLVAACNRRRQKFEAQLPDAIDILVRSLKVGHPVATAIKSVARELADPTGSEFAIVADELMYGLDLETAMSNLSMRVGQQDLALVVVAISIQAKSGGNLAEILAGISKVIRDRLRMRLKVKALSAEGRFSAMVLSILPFGLFALLWLIAPHFYGEVWHFPHVKPALLAATVWMVIGDLIMYRMVKFEI